MKPTYTLVRTFKSKSRPGTIYRVKRNDQTGVLSCDCPGWIYGKDNPRTCFHHRAILGQPLDVKAYRDAVAKGTIQPVTPIAPIPAQSTPAQPDVHPSTSGVHPTAMAAPVGRLLRQPRKL